MVLNQITSSPTETRPDGRSTGSILRPLSCEISCLSRADGSAKFSAGQTSVLAAVYGPAAPRVAQREKATEAVIGVVFKHGSKSGGSSSVGSNKALSVGYGATEREIERFITGTIAECVVVRDYPRTVIEVVIQILKADGGVISVAINSAIVALMDAGISMRSIPVSTTLLVKHSGISSELRLDPTAEEEIGTDCAATIFVTDNANYGVVSCLTSGIISQDSYLSCIEASSRASKAVIAFMRLAIEQKVTREVQTLWSS